MNRLTTFIKKKLRIKSPSKPELVAINIQELIEYLHARRDMAKYYLADLPLGSYQRGYCEGKIDAYRDALGYLHIYD